MDDVAHLGFHLNGMHNVVHLSLGAVWLGASTRHEWARLANAVIGAALLVVGVVGPTGAVDSLLNIEDAVEPDNYLHLATGVVALWFGTHGAAPRRCTPSPASTTAKGGDMPLTDDRPVVTTPLHEAKRPVTPLAGPYGHPFHPILVTVPIGAWVVSIIFDLVSRWADEAEVFVKGSFWLIGVGILGAVAAAVFGLLDLLGIARGTPAFRTGLVHMALNLTVVALFAVSFAVRRDHLDEADVTIAGFVLSAVALALLGVSGWLGGKLAYRYGVRVADEQTQADGFTSREGRKR